MLSASCIRRSCSVFARIEAQAIAALVESPRVIDSCASLRAGNRKWSTSSAVGGTTASSPSPAHSAARDGSRHGRSQRPRRRRSTSVQQLEYDLAQLETPRLRELLRVVQSRKREFRLRIDPVEVEADGSGDERSRRGTPCLPRQRLRPGARGCGRKRVVLFRAQPCRDSLPRLRRRRRLRLRPRPVVDRSSTPRGLHRRERARRSLASHAGGSVGRWCPPSEHRGIRAPRTRLRACRTRKSWISMSLLCSRLSRVRTRAGFPPGRRIRSSGPCFVSFFRNFFAAGLTLVFQNGLT